MEVMNRWFGHNYKNDGTIDNVYIAFIIKNNEGDYLLKSLWGKREEKMRKTYKSFSREVDAQDCLFNIISERVNSGYMNADLMEYANKVPIEKRISSHDYDYLFEDKESLSIEEFEKRGLIKKMSFDKEGFIEPKKTGHTYTPPRFTHLIQSLLEDESSKNIWLVGPSGSGKTHFVEYLAKKMNRKLYKIDGCKELSRHDFLGEKDLVIDEETGSNFIKYIDGILIKAMQEGLDENGKEVGYPAILFIDEMGGISADTALALNGVLESRLSQRTINLTRDGGRNVVSHRNFRIIAAANVTGRGIESISEMDYTAQADALDFSTLRRFAAVFRFGYDNQAEIQIMREKISDHSVIDRLCQFRTSVRNSIKQGDTRTPFSTGLIVDICDLYRIWGDIVPVLYYGVFEKLNNDEKSHYNEFAKKHFDKDILRLVCEDTNMDFM